MKCVYGRAGVRYVITKFSRMDSLPNFVTHGAPLRARFARARSSAKKKNENAVYYNLYGDMKQLSSKPKFKVGDKVRISEFKRKVFDKGYTPNWTEQIFMIDKIQSTNPITYRLKDLNNEEIQGSFYEPELLPAKQDVFRIEKVIRRDYKKKQALVKWLGYSDDFNSWIPLSNLQELSN